MNGTQQQAEMFDYEAWVSEQAEKVGSAVNRLAMGGIYDEAVYLIPADGKIAGELVVLAQPAEMREVVRFGVYGARVSNIPRSHLSQAIWNACRRLPIVPQH